MTDQLFQVFLPMNPPTVTAQEHKLTVLHGRPHYYDPPELTDARNKLTAHLARYAPEKPFDGALKLHTIWCFPITGKHKDGEYRITRPDCSNIIKLFEDCMTKLGFWHDDAQIAISITEKHWADLPGIFIRIEAL